MGGMVMIVESWPAYLIAGRGASTRWRPASVLVVMVGFGDVGVADDLMKVRRRRSLGLKKTAKIAARPRRARIHPPWPSTAPP